MRAQSGLLFISWQPYCSRSDGIASGLGGHSYMVYSPLWGSRWSTILFKYFSQSIKTLMVLIRQRPRVVAVMSPPVVACIPVWLYCLISRAQFMIDAHTGAFIDERWRRVLCLQRFFCRRAVTTIVTSKHFQRLIESWGANAMIVTDVPVIFAAPRDVKATGEFRVTLVCSFTYDEPIETFLEAARLLTDTHFYVTGNCDKLDPALRQLMPKHVHLTGFLSDAEYTGRLKSSHAIMALTKFDHTMQRGAYEAIYLGKPVITSDFQILREAFPIGTVHVENSPDSIVRGVNRMRSNLEQFQTEAEQLRQQKLEHWQDVADRLACALGIGETNPQSPATVSATRI